VYFVHVSTKESVNYIRDAQKAGQKVYAETCPQYLLLDHSKYYGTSGQVLPYIMSPPLRSAEDQEALWQGISDGTIQSIGTDHCPFNLSQKEFGINDFRNIPNGAGGVEHRLSLLYTYGYLQNKISINRLVDLVSTNPAKIFGLYPLKGEITEGADADLIVWNPNKEQIISAKTHHQKCDINIFEGFKTIGKPEYVILNGRIVNNF
jgi:dihydropyrimidinase